MNQEKIGKFIALRRKHVNLTQLQLAEKLGITDRAVSKWETGKTMPDSAIMLELCDILGITVNDLLHGEVVTMEKYNEQSEKLLVELTKQKEEADKRMLTLEWVISILSCIILFVPMFIAAFMPIKEWVKVVIVISGFIPGLIGLHFAMVIEQTAGYYACRKCGHKHVPTLGAVYAAPHMGRTRRMRCPVCGMKSWQKKVLSKD